jgi:hypothetical protein
VTGSGPPTSPPSAPQVIASHPSKSYSDNIPPSTSPIIPPLQSEGFREEVVCGVFALGGHSRSFELLVVITVIGVLATLVVPNVFRHLGAAKEATARSQIEMLGGRPGRLPARHRPLSHERAGTRRAMEMRGIDTEAVWQAGIA